MKKSSVIGIVLLENFLHACHMARMENKKYQKTVVVEDVTIDEETAQAIVELRNSLSIPKKEEFDKQTIESQIALSLVAKDFFAGKEIVITEPGKSKKAKSKPEDLTKKEDPKAGPKE